MRHDLNILRHIVFAFRFLLLGSLPLTLTGGHEPAILLQRSHLCKLSLRQLAVTAAGHLEKSLLLVNQGLHLGRVLLRAFQDLLPSTTYGMAPTSEMSRLIGLAWWPIFRSCLIKGITDIVLMIWVLRMNIKLLPAIRSTKGLRVVVYASIHTLVETRSFGFVSRLLVRLTLLANIPLRMVHLVTWVCIVLLRMLLQHQLFVFILLHHFLIIIKTRHSKLLNIKIWDYFWSRR